MNLEYFSPSISTLYAEMLQQLTAMEAERAIADLKRTFVSKQIKGKKYWYLQYSEGGRQKQVYLGNENDELLKIIREHQKGKQLKASDYQNRDRLFLCRPALLFTNFWFLPAGPPLSKQRPRKTGNKLFFYWRCY